MSKFHQMHVDHARAAIENIEILYRAIERNMTQEVNARNDEASRSALCREILGHMDLIEDCFPWAMFEPVHVCAALGVIVADWED